MVEGVDSDGDFVIGAELGEDHAVIAVRGELAALAATDLSTMLEAAMAGGCLWIVVDLSGVSHGQPHGSHRAGSGGQANRRT